MCFCLASENDIHNCLSLPAVALLPPSVPALQPGTAAGVVLGLGTVEHQSRVNLIQWLDQIVANMPKRYAKNAVKIEDAVGTVIPGSYEGIIAGECGKIVAKISALSEWMVQAVMAGTNLGRLEISYGGGVGNVTHQQDRFFS